MAEFLDFSQRVYKLGFTRQNRCPAGGNISFALWSGAAGRDGKNTCQLDSRSAPCKECKCDFLPELVGVVAVARVIFDLDIVNHHFILGVAEGMQILWWLSVRLHEPLDKIFVAASGICYMFFRFWPVEKKGPSMSVIPRCLSSSGTSIKAISAISCLKGRSGSPDW